MKASFFYSRRIYLFFSFLLLLVASFLSFVLPPETRSIIPHTEIVIPCINSLCALLALFFIFKPDYYKGQYAVLFLQSISTIMTGYETLGIFLYMSLIILLLCDGQFKKNIHRKIAFLISIWALSILSLIPFGWNRVLLSYFTLLFFIAFYNFIYIKLRYMLSPLLPKKKEDGSKLFPPPGSNLKLEDYGVSERQKVFAMDCINENLSYKEISQKHFVSISTVKAEMACLFKCLGVKNREDLRFFLFQYNLI